MTTTGYMVVWFPLANIHAVAAACVDFEKTLPKRPTSEDDDAFSLHATQLVKLSPAHTMK